MRRSAAAAFAALSFASAAQSERPEPLYTDAQLGRQLRVAEIRKIVVGNSWTWGSGDKITRQFIARDGSLKGSSGTRTYTLKWHFRDYDNLFCIDSGDPASSGCVQLLRKGDQISFRRKDGVVELTATLKPGNAFAL